MPASPVTGGNRRIDRVLAPGYSEDLTALPLAELRARRAEADQEEVDLSYVRRLLQGRLDIVGAELARRGEQASGPLVDALAGILSEDRDPAQGVGRSKATQPSRVGETRRSEEALAGDTSLDDPEAMTPEQLRAAVDRLVEEEAAVSAQRRQVQAVLDRLSDEVIARYRDGSATVESLLQQQG